jgi:hypothetical protein
MISPSALSTFLKEGDFNGIHALSLEDVSRAGGKIGLQED